MKKRYHLYFYGRVQGVGFRFTAYQLAAKLGLTGWVRNEYDGSVQMEVQGPAEALPVLLERLNAQRFIRIDSVDTTECALDESERSFSVR